MVTWENLNIFRIAYLVDSVLFFPSLQANDTTDFYLGEVQNTLEKKRYSHLSTKKYGVGSTKVGNGDPLENSG